MILNRLERILDETNNKIAFVDLAAELDMTADDLDEAVETIMSLLKRVQMLETHTPFTYDELEDCSDNYDDTGFGITSQDEDSITLDSGERLYIQK